MSAPPRLSGRALFWAVTLGLCSVRLIAAAWTPFTEDEAYYRLWAQAPASGYYDHPPMIAWWIGLGRALLGDTALGVRVIPILGNLVTARLTVAWAGAMAEDEDTAWRAGLFFNLTLLALGGGFLATPDNPATLFWVATLYCCAKAERGGVAWWLGAGLAAGAACLSKYSALFIGPGVFLWLMLSKPPRGRMLTPGPWLALVAAVLVFSPNIIWNAGHHWATMIKQFGRIQAHRLTPLGPLAFVAVQALLMNPVLAWSAVQTVRGRRFAELCVVAVAPFALYLAFHALHDKVEAHWAAPLYPAIAVLAARTGPRLWAVSATPALALAGLCVSLSLSAGELGRLDPLRSLRGWPAFIQRVDALHPAWIGTTSYGLAARLNAPPGVAAPVLQIAERVRYRDLETPRVDFTRPGLIIDLTRRIDERRLDGCFSKVEAVGEIHRGNIHAGSTTYGIYQVSGPRRDILRDGCW